MKPSIQTVNETQAAGTTTPLVAVIVLSWNNEDLLDECFESVYRQTYKNWELILVDNASADQSVARTREHHPKVKIIENSKNLGFAIANNIGIKKAFENPDVRYVVLLNSDARLREDWIETLVTFAEDHPKGAGFQSPTLDYYDHAIYDSCGIVMSQGALATQIAYREKNLKLKSQKVFGVNAAAALYSRSFFEAQPFGDDYLDSDLFIYLEDVDLAARTIMMGWDNYLVTGTEAYHMGSASSGKLPGFSMYMTYRNNWLVLVKNFPMRIIIRTLPGMIRAEFARLRAFTREGKFILVKKILLGRLHSLPRLPLFLKKRRQLKKYWDITEFNLWKLMAVPELPHTAPLTRPFGTEKVAIAVLTHNNATTIQSCLKALTDQDYPDVDLIIVDNASTDNTVQTIKKHFPDLTVYTQTDNLGTANGYNVGINEIIKGRDQSDYIALIQGHTIVDPGWLSILVEAIRQHPSAFIMGSRVAFETSAQTAKTSKLEFSGYTYLPGHLPEPDARAGADRITVAASNYACLVRVEFIGPVGFIDGEYYNTYEDVDWSVRARLLGYTTHVTSRTTAHVQAPAPDPISPYTWYHSHKNAYYLYLKTIPFKLFWKFFPTALTSAASESFSALRQGLWWPLVKTIAKCVVKTPRMLGLRGHIHARRIERAKALERIFVSRKITP